MTRKNRKLLILSIFCILSILTAIPGFMLSTRNSNINSVKSVLLNPKYTDAVNEITLSFPENEYFSFNKKVNLQGNEVWICTVKDSFMFPANSTVINQLLERASQTISMAEVSDSYSAWNALGLSDDTAINLKFTGNNPDGSSQVYSSLFFGYENADSSMIYVRSDRKSSSWRITNTYSSYLTDSISTWADQALLPIGYNDEQDSSVSCIKVNSNGTVSSLYSDVSNSKEFYDSVHTLLSLRSSGIFSSDDFMKEAPQAVPVMTITLSGSSKDYGLTVYEAEFEDETEYFVRNFGILSEGEAQYVQQISSWTASRIAETTTW